MLLFFVAAALLAATAALAAASARLSGVAFVLAAYLFGWAEVVVLAEVLSPAHAIGRVGYAVGQVLLAVAAFAVWRKRGSPRPQLPRVRLAHLREEPLLVLLGLGVLAALAYEAFVAVGTPPNNWDAMAYHLSRAAAWLRRGSLGYFAAHSQRENAYPLNAELGILYTFVYAGRDTFAALTQFLAELAALTAIYGIARRLGFRVAAAAFAALTTATLSEIALESMTAQNDLVVAAFVATAVFFLLDRNALLAALAIALALGTKLTALFILPVLALLALAVLPRRQLIRLVACSLASFALVGAWSYADNLHRTGHVFGVVPEEHGYKPTLSPVGTVSTIARIYDRFVDFTGTSLQLRPRFQIAAANAWLFRETGIPANPPQATTKGDAFDYVPNVYANEDISYFGMLGALLVLPLSAAFALAGLRRGRLRSPRFLLALALPLFTLTLALANSYNSFLGRFMILPVVLTMPLAAWLYQRRLHLLTTLVAVIGLVTLACTHLLNVTKPTLAPGPIWTMTRTQAESVIDRPLGEAVAAIDREVPAHTQLGLDLGTDDAVYPLYGPQLSRTLIALPARHPLAAAKALRLRWVVLADAHIGHPPGWQIHPLANGWRLASFTAPAT